jgi:hypothetical protein
MNGFTHVGILTHASKPCCCLVSFMRANPVLSQSDHPLLTALLSSHGQFVKAVTIDAECGLSPHRMNQKADPSQDWMSFRTTGRADMDPS